MWMITAILFATLAALLYLRQRHLLHKIDELAACAERRQPLLLEHRGSIVTTRKLERLHDAVNGLISDSRVGEDRDRDYLRQIETTLGSIREAVLIVDDGNYVRMANDAARQLIGMDKTLLGRRLESLVQSAGFLDYVRAIRGGARSANEAVEIHARRRRPLVRSQRHPAPPAEGRAAPLPLRLA
jgi:two-component system phosphate regulon sensor histidine kinase PhoR